jgi:Arc/MetJ-type ribon-helix-helix transcriptional regulator
MTMLSFRVPDADAAEAQRWAKRLGLDRSELLRRALQAHLAQLAAEEDAAAWEQLPLTDTEQAFVAVADWGPAEDWGDWADAAR